MQQELLESTDGVMPFLKWAGGKRWLIGAHLDLFPVDYNHYIEPFLGSGATFFTMNPAHAILSDSNEWLIETYKAIKKDWKRVVDYLRVHQRKHSLSYYYQVRDGEARNEFTRAAKLIYLNRTCWNGLFRVNRKGEFNVPIGTKQKVILDSDDFENVSRRLRKARLLNCDFEVAINAACEGDFIYADPPYIVNHQNNGFVKYNNKLFTWSDQERLSEALFRAYRRGAKIILSNAMHYSIRSLYKDWCDVIILQRASVISGSNNGRGICKEYVITAGL